MARFNGKVGLAMYKMSTIKRKKKSEKYVNWDKGVGEMTGLWLGPKFELLESLKQLLIQVAMIVTMSGREVMEMNLWKKLSSSEARTL